MLANNDVRVAICKPTEEQAYFYRNGEGDEVLFVHEGEGMLETIFGNLPYRRGDYLYVPIGRTWRPRPGGGPDKIAGLRDQRRGNDATPIPQRTRSSCWSTPRFASATFECRCSCSPTTSRAN